MRESSESKPKTETRSRDAISPDVRKVKGHCEHCGKSLFAGDTIARVLFGVLCEVCTDEANACLQRLKEDHHAAALADFANRHEP